MNLNLFTFSTLLLSVTSLLLSIILFVFGKSKLHKMWGFYNLAVSFWGVCGYFAGSAVIAKESLLWWRIAHFGVATIPIFLYHGTLLFCNSSKRKFLYFAYLQGIFFILLIPTQTFFNGINYRFDSFFYPTLGIAYHAFFFTWIFIVLVSQYDLFVLYKNATGIRRTQISYLFFGLIVGFVGGITNFLPGYTQKIYPFGNITIPIYNAIVAFAILRYRLLDIKLVITRTSIFLAVYSLVLGIPFALVFRYKEYLKYLFNENWWMAPLLTSTVLATLGPIIYLYFQKKAEERLLQAQQQYQLTLRKASLGMGQIKDLQRLLNLIVHIVTRAVRIEHCEIYLLHEDSQKYVMKASKGSSLKIHKSNFISSSAALVRQLKRTKEPVIYDEIQQRIRDYTDSELILMEKELIEYSAELIVPSFIEGRLIAIISLGKKKSEELYSQDDLVVFSILASQAALAIENAQFYEETQKTHQQLFKAEKMATIGTMADGLSHQINNRLHAMGFIAGDALDTLKRFKLKKTSKETKELIDNILNALERIEDNVKRGGEIVQGLLTYTRKGEEGFSPVALNKLLDASIEMAQFKVKLSEMKIHRNLNGDLPKIKGNFTQLQEVFFNIIDNSYDAIIQRKEELKEPGFSGILEITAFQNGTKLEIIIKDNGMGAKEESLQKIFTPFFTTKLSSKKGTGLGMYIIKQIINENHKGKVEFTSKYKKGSQTRILLPIFIDEINKIG